MTVDELTRRLRAAGCVFAEEEAALLIAESADERDLERRTAEREAGLPLELVLGWAEFCGLRIRVAPGVFVPRQRSTHIVRAALAETPTARTVLDLACGTGALGAAIAADHACALWATDLDPDAVAIARTNLEPLGGTVVEGDLYEALPRDVRFDLIVANAPYVPTDAIAFMPPEAREHEHRMALDGGGDGLELQRRAIAEAPEWLVPGGVLVVESSERQAERSLELFTRAGFRARIERDDELDGTVIVGVLGQPSASR